MLGKLLLPTFKSTLTIFSQHQLYGWVKVGCQHWARSPDGISTTLISNLLTLGQHQPFNWAKVEPLYFCPLGQCWADQLLATCKSNLPKLGQHQKYGWVPTLPTFIPTLPILGQRQPFHWAKVVPTSFGLLDQSWATELKDFSHL